MNNASSSTDGDIVILRLVLSIYILSDHTECSKYLIRRGPLVSCSIERSKPTGTIIFTVLMKSELYTEFMILQNFMRLRNGEQRLPLISTMRKH